LTRDFRSEAELIDFAGRLGSAWRAAGCDRLVIGLRGDLGSGKTTWARALLRGLGFAGRVPSPTYTLLEPYAFDGLLVLHLDLYRIDGDGDLENLGLRDWLGADRVWLLIEWPERAPTLKRRADLSLAFAVRGASERRLVVSARTDAGIVALEAARHANSKNDM
jgi:tRNA threonylcarbamoyladenosine biosynthesis protein TsaE